MNVLVEYTDSTLHEEVVARTLTRVDKGHWWVRVANVSVNTIFLPADSKVGMLKPIQAIPSSLDNRQRIRLLVSEVS